MKVKVARFKIEFIYFLCRKKNFRLIKKLKREYCFKLNFFFQIKNRNILFCNFGCEDVTQSKSLYEVKFRAIQAVHAGILHGNHLTPLRVQKFKKRLLVVAGR